METAETASTLGPGICFGSMIAPETKTIEYFQGAEIYVKFGRTHFVASVSAINSSSVIRQQTVCSLRSDA